MWFPMPVFVLSVVAVVLLFVAARYARKSDSPVVSALLSLVLFSAMLGLAGFGLGNVVVDEFQADESPGIMIGAVGGAVVGSIWAATFLLLGAITGRAKRDT